MTDPELSWSSTFACGEVRGGNGISHHLAELPGLRGVMYSRPCTGPHGGDIHYLSVCGSGLMSRVCLADVAGHGEVVATIGRDIHDHLRRSVDVIDERKVLSRFNDRLDARDVRAMTTAVLVTYYPPRQRLTVCYAGHPLGWLYRAAVDQWTPLAVDVPAPAERPAFVDIPLGTGLPALFTRHSFSVAPGDRILLVTDGVLEATSPDDRQFDRHGIERVLQATQGKCEDIADRLLEALHAHAETDELAHDDVTFFLGEIVDGPPGPALWHVVKNRLLSKTAESAPDTAPAIGPRLP
jgi:serine phosphatase RsbU (regulator of sigma subunit)